MKAPEEDRRTGGEAAGARIERFVAGDVLTLDGATGRVVRGEAPLVAPEPSEGFETVLRWADETRDFGVRANADTPEDAWRAREQGAEGIGLCRTEHMLSCSPFRVPGVRLAAAQAVLKE
ncbi:MAG TPA: putative PEP-binding protein [Rubrobacteraceae bacterium]|jgi:pyruvate,orthophosphate dikinase|nr:putative PEP-binding protein [Rubrobacteraceae bacterium]